MPLLGDTDAAYVHVYWSCSSGWPGSILWTCGMAPAAWLGKLPPRGNSNVFCGGVHSPVHPPVVNGSSCSR